MPIIAFANQKGGVGKTTLAANVAAEWATQGVAILDADPQRSMLQWAESGEGFLSQVTRPVDGEDLKIFKQSVQDASEACRWVVIDTPPALEKTVMLAALIADLVLIPVQASPLDIKAARETVRLIRQAREQRTGGSPFAGLVPSRIMPRTNLGRDLGVTLGALGEPVMPGVTQRVGIVEAALVGQVLREYDPTNPATQEIRRLAKAVERTLK